MAVTLCVLGLACSVGRPAFVDRNVSVRVLGRDLVAIEHSATDVHALALEPGERVLSHEARRNIGIAVTDRRIAGYTAASGWTERRLRVAEATPSRADLGEWVAVFLTSQRAIAFDGHWREVNFGPHEGVLRSSVESDAVVVVTNLRALAMTTTSNGFHPIAIREGERVEDVYAGANGSEVRTAERILTFAGSWSEVRRRIK